MSTLLYGLDRGPHEHADENVVRRSTFEVNPQLPPKMAPDAPDPNEVETDSDPHLGMVRRTLASKWNEGEKSAPFYADTATAPHDSIVNDRRASVGTAAEREAAGQFGHGTAKYAEGIEPVGDLTAAGGFGNEYWASDKPPIQSGAGSYMTPTPDLEGARFNAAAATDRSRNAYQSSGVYSMWYQNTVGSSRRSNM